MEIALVRITAQIIVGLSVVFIEELQLWFLIPWILGWSIYRATF